MQDFIVLCWYFNLTKGSECFFHHCFYSLLPLNLSSPFLSPRHVSEESNREGGVEGQSNGGSGERIAQYERERERQRERERKVLSTGNKTSWHPPHPQAPTPTPKSHTSSSLSLSLPSASLLSSSIALFFSPFRCKEIYLNPGSTLLSLFDSTIHTVIPASLLTQTLSVFCQGFLYGAPLTRSGARQCLCLLSHSFREQYQHTGALRKAVTQSLHFLAPQKMNCGNFTYRIFTPLQA